MLPLSRTRIKICGLTRSEDVQSASACGADALGFVFFANSPRYTPPPLAAELMRIVPPFVSTIGLFVNPDATLVYDVLKTLPLDTLQFHGDESPEFCRQFKRPYLKAIRVKPGVDLLQCARHYHDAQGLLLDAFVEGTHGGTGATFDWQLIPADLPLPVILSGGLHAGNVAEAIRRVRPSAVDVSSGVEESKGIKSSAKIAAFIHEVNKIEL